MRAHNNWSRFTEDMDDVVPLGMKGPAEVHTALTWLFNNEKKLVYPEPCADLHHTS